MRVNVYGKLDGSCKLCEAAKDKLKMLNVKFTSFELSHYAALHDGWRSDESVEVLACYSDINTYPVITINGKAMSYPEAIKRLKSNVAPKPAKAAAPVRVAEPVEEGDLVAV